jgi:hypothetical protein
MRLQVLNAEGLEELLGVSEILPCPDVPTAGTSLRWTPEAIDGDAVESLKGNA